MGVSPAPHSVLIVRAAAREFAWLPVSTPGTLRAPPGGMSNTGNLGRIYLLATLATRGEAPITLLYGACYDLGEAYGWVGVADLVESTLAGCNLTPAQRATAWGRYVDGTDERQSKIDARERGVWVARRCARVVGLCKERAPQAMEMLWRRFLAGVDATCGYNAHVSWPESSLHGPCQG